MVNSIKELIIVLLIASVIFGFGKPLALKFMSAQDFCRRRNVWLALTITAFLSPSFWLFVLVAALLITWARRRDPNPVALYLMLLHVIPPMSIEIPVVGIGQLFEMDNYRLLSFALLIPAIVELRKSKASLRIHRLELMDYCLLAFGVLQVVLYVPADLPNHVILPDSMTNAIRRGFLFFVDTYVVYYAISRSCTTARSIIEAQATFCIACAIMAGVAGYESLHNWLMYADMSMRWNPLQSAWSLYITRSDTVRASASAGHSLALGYLLAIAFGFWIYLSRQVESLWARSLGVLLYWYGLISAYARGPWIGAAAIYFAYAGNAPRAARNVLKALCVTGLIAAPLSMTPWGTKIINLIPYFGGSVDNGNVLYRERLADRSWELIKAHPFFGDQSAYLSMEDLRQGQGIIDLVNTYASTALFYGLIGLACFSGFILTALLTTYRNARKMRSEDPEIAYLGACLVACIAGTLLMLENTSFDIGYRVMFFVLAGLAAAYAHLRPLEAATGRLPKAEASVSGSKSKWLKTSAGI